MAQCVTQATQTRNDVRTEQNVSTSFSASLITAAATTTTITTTSTSCVTAASASAEAECETVTGTSVSVIPGGVQTTQVPVLITQVVTVSNPTTLYGTSCRDTTSNPGSTPTPSSNESSNNNNNGTPSNTAASDAVSVTTPPPSTFLSSSMTTDASGNPTFNIVTVTTTPAASTIGQAPGTEATNSGGHKSNANVGAIVGGAVGGFIGIVAILALIWFFIRRRKKWDNVFDKDYDDYMTGRKHPGAEHRMDLESEIDDGPPMSEPKPYFYGLVGGSSPPGHSPPGTPPTTAGTVDQHNANPSPSPARSMQHEREGSITPLHAQQPSLSGAHSLQGSITSPPVMHAPSDGYFPAITPPVTMANSRPSPSPSPLPPPSASFTSPPPRSASPGLPPGAAPPAGTSSSSAAAAPTNQPPKRTSTSSSVRSSIVDYPLHRGVLQVTNADVLPASPRSPALPLGASSAPKNSSPLQLDLGGDDDIFNPEALFSSVGRNSRT